MSDLSFSDRIQGMIWGQFVGDAAALGTHWIYDLDELATTYPEIQGFEQPQAGHYHEGKKPGDQTHYGDAALLLLESVAEKGHFDVADFAQRFVAFFGSPETVTYRDHATKETLEHLQADPENYRNGADDNQPATITRMASVVAIHGADPEVIETLTRFSQNNAQAVAYCHANARILSALLEGADVATALSQGGEEEATANVTQAVASLESSAVEATLRFGQSCPLPNSFPSAAHVALRHPHDFGEAILETIRAGGDNAARASMIGAWLGAHGGVAAVPPDWRSKLTAGPRIEAALEQLKTKTAAAVHE